ncbi:unnamed protein product, partial [Prorocentrum cordatum]
RRPRRGVVERARFRRGAPPRAGAPCRNPGGAQAYGPRTRWALAALAACVQVHRLPAQDYSDICRHEDDANVSDASELADGTQEFRIIDANNTQRWFYRNFNVTTFNTAEDYRNVIFNLEPCVGSVLLMVRKTRRCYPNPYSCIDLGSDTRNSADCQWVPPACAALAAPRPRPAAAAAAPAAAPVGEQPLPGERGQAVAKRRDLPVGLPNNALRAA